MTNSLVKPLARTQDIIIQNLDKETLIYDLDANKAYALNETSRVIWELCDGKKTASEIAAECSKKFKNPISEDLIWFALAQLNKNNILANDGMFEPVTALNRRQTIKKLGLTSLVALPIVSSIVAPTAANAQSVPATCVTGTCIGDAENICLMCNLQVMVDLFASSDTSCTGPVTPIIVDCTGGFMNQNGDTRITSP